MSYLLIEDDKYKALDIEETLKEFFPLLKPIIKCSYSSGVKEALFSDYNFILLDMSMPTFDITENEKGGIPRHFAGEDIILQMHRRGIHTPVIIITQFENFGEGKERTTLKSLTEKLLKINFKGFQGTVFYSNIEKNWQQELCSKIKLIMEMDT